MVASAKRTFSETPIAFSRTVRLLPQALIVVGSITMYFGVRSVTEGRPDMAVRNGEWLIALERRLGLAWEAPMQDLVIGSPLLTTLLNWIYIYGHWPVIAVSLVWLASRHPMIYFRVRNAMIGSGLVGMLIFATVPVAPPRLAGLGLIDTLTQQSNTYRVLQPTAFTNQYAALPSLHVGWNLIISMAILVAARHVLIKMLAVTMTVAMDLAVVLTANHYVLDVVAGAALAIGAWMFAGRRRLGRCGAFRQWPPSRIAANDARAITAVPSRVFSSRRRNRPPPTRARPLVSSRRRRAMLRGLP